MKTNTSFQLSNHHPHSFSPSHDSSKALALTEIGWSSGPTALPPTNKSPNSPRHQTPTWTKASWRFWQKGHHRLVHPGAPNSGTHIPILLPSESLWSMGSLWEGGHTIGDSWRNPECCEGKVQFQMQKSWDDYSFPVAFQAPGSKLHV